MHEMSLAEGVLQIIEDEARAQSFSRVKTVWLEIGQLAGVEKEAMLFCFDAVVRDSVAQDLRGVKERDRERLRQLAHIEALSLDPCVAYEIEVRHA